MFALAASPQKVLIAWLRTGCTPAKVSSMLGKSHRGSASSRKTAVSRRRFIVRMPVCHESGQSTRRESMPLDRNHAQPVFQKILIVDTWYEVPKSLYLVLGGLIIPPTMSLHLSELDCRNCCCYCCTSGRVSGSVVSCDFNLGQITHRSFLLHDMKANSYAVGN